MRSIRRRACATAALSVVLVIGATACGSQDDSGGNGDSAAGQPAATPSSNASATDGSGSFTLPKDLRDKLRQHGVDVDKWQNGEWKNWDKDQWLRHAGEFLNPVIKGLWDPKRAGQAQPEQPTTPPDTSGDQGRTDPAPSPVTATSIAAPYSDNAPGLGRLLFDTPKGQAACSAAVVKDPAHPGRSDLVWTAGHCVHAGRDGGWYRNMVFAPSFNDAGRLSESQVNSAPREQVFPKGLWWADDASTSKEWISGGGEKGGTVPAAPYDFAIIHVTPEKGTTTSLEQAAGGAYDLDFQAPAVGSLSRLEAQGYPAKAPFDGSKAEQCLSRPSRLSMAASKPTMYRIGCTMTPGSSGGPWFASVGGRKEIVSNTSIGPTPSTWLAGPHLGPEAQQLYQAMSRKHAAG